MSELERALDEIRGHDGVEQVLLIGRDGLLVHQLGSGQLDSETVAALTPGLLAACSSLGEAAGSGSFSTAVVEWSDAVGIVGAVSDDLLLAVVLRRDVGFAPLLRAIRERRSRIAELVE